MSRTKIITISIIVTLGIILMIVIAVLNRNSQPDDTTTSDPSEQQLTSSEGGKEITPEDIKTRDELEDFASDQMINHLKAQFPDHQNILTKGVEWYFTEENKSDNILVRAEVVNSDGSRTEELNVIEITRTGNTLTNKQIYKPDERYSL